MGSAVKWLAVMIVVAGAATAGFYSCSASTDGNAAADGADINGGKDAGEVTGDGGKPSDAGGGGSDGGGKKDGGTTVTGCTARDQECGPTEVCNFETGTCVAGQPCPGGVSNCAYAFPDNPDAYYCDTVGKVCKRRLMICEPCATDEECGENAAEGGNEDRCIDYPDGTRCGKACGTLRCPAGFECAPVTPPGTGPNANQCRPMRPTQADPFTCNGVTPCESSSDCPDPNRPKCYIYNAGAKFGVCAAYCESDNDCPIDLVSGMAKVCNLDTGSCVPGCVRPDGTMDDGKCPAPKVCHTSGKCGSACGTDTDCSNMFGTDVEWICDGGKCRFCLEKDPVSGVCTKNGCLNDAECPFPGYCDRTTRECQDNKCRNEKDCLSGYKCENAVCIKLSCLENGGATVACDIFQFCCKEGKATACADPSGGTVDDGQCYTASTPPWCTTCEKNEECAKDAGYNDMCIEFQDKDGGTLGKFCGVPCTVDPDGGTTPQPGECPRGHQCVDIKDQDGVSQGGACLWQRCTTWNQDAGTPDGGTPGGDATGGDL